MPRFRCQGKINFQKLLRVAVPHGKMNLGYSAESGTRKEENKMTKKLVDVFGQEAFEKVCDLLKERDDLRNQVQVLEDDNAHLCAVVETAADVIENINMQNAELKEEVEALKKKCEELERELDEGYELRENLADDRLQKEKEYNDSLWFRMDQLEELISELFGKVEANDK